MNEVLDRIWDNIRTGKYGQINVNDDREQTMSFASEFGLESWTRKLPDGLWERVSSVGQVPLDVRENEVKIYLSTRDMANARIANAQYLAAISEQLPQHRITLHAAPDVAHDARFPHGYTDIVVQNSAPSEVERIAQACITVWNALSDAP